MAFGFEGRVALVTGAAGDIGWAIVGAFHESGATVVAVDRDGDALKGRAARLADTGRCLTVALDLDAEAGPDRAIGAAIDRFGHVDVLVNNAAHEPLRGTIDAMDLKDWDKTLGVNLGAAFLLTRLILPVMRRRGSGVVVNVASQLAHVAAPGSAAYSASKAALLALTRSIAVDHAHEGVRAVSVSPGAVLTGRLTRLFGSEQAAVAALAPNHPAGRLGSPREVADAVLFLASDQAAFINGADLVIDGGYTAR